MFFENFQNNFDDVFYRSTVLILYSKTKIC